MIPTTQEAIALWDTYHLPENKRRHSQLVANVAAYLAGELEKKNIHVEKQLLVSAALLHDIDKNVLKNGEEKHPDTGVRILKEQKMDEVSRLVATHPLHLIIHPETAPHTIEEKLLFLSDKMVKYDIITVDKRFALWREEPLSKDERKILETAYPLVKKIEQEFFSIIGIRPEDVAGLIH